MLSCANPVMKAGLAAVFVTAGLACGLPSGGGATTADDGTNPVPPPAEDGNGGERRWAPVRNHPDDEELRSPDAGTDALSPESSDGASFGVRLRCVGFLHEDGPIMHAMIVRSADSWPIALGVRPIINGVTSFQWAHLLEPGVSYRVELFTSDDPFPSCHMPPNRAWRLTLPMMEADFDFYAQRSEEQSQEACKAFDPKGVEP